MAARGVGVVYHADRLLCVWLGLGGDGEALHDRVTYWSLRLYFWERLKQQLGQVLNLRLVDLA